MAWRRSRKSRLLSGLAIFTALLIVCSVYYSNPNTAQLHDSHTGRRLLEAEVHEELNCTPRSIEQFPQDFFTEEQRKHGGVVVHIAICFYIFACLAIVCDDYFVASLEKFSTVLHMQSDVAGATFMAAGSSAPELFTSIVGVFFAKSDVGLGTIVGSAVFNLLAIISVVSLFAGQVIYLLWWPMTRDCIVYVISVLTLALVIMDNLVMWYESLIMLVMYLLYILLMVFNQRIGNKAVQLFDRCCPSSKPEEDEKDAEKQEQAMPLQTQNGGPEINHEEENKPKENGTDVHLIKENKLLKNVIENGSIHSSNRSLHNSLRSIRSSQSKKDHDLVSSGLFLRSLNSLNSDPETKEEEESEFESPFKVPDTWPKRIFWVIMMPLSILFVLTIPDCRRGGCWAKLFPITFIMSIAWLGALTYVMVWMVTIIGDTFGIPDAVMGLTLLAAGTSIPDALASLFVAKDGYGDMAVSNSIGSNIFDILLCLGLPWLLHSAVVAPGDAVHINSNGIIFTTISVLGTVVFILATMLLSKWKLNKKVGIILFVVYVIVITIACLFEMNIFYDINPPPCDKA